MSICHPLKPLLMAIARSAIGLFNMTNPVSAASLTPDTIASTWSIDLINGSGDA